jgi:chitin disaccharide deacetylase
MSVTRTLHSGLHTALRRKLTPGLIINADDLGIHPSINAGILSAYRNGILTSCTMLMTTPYLKETVHNFVRPAALPIGIHLSLTLGRAVAGHNQIPGLVDERGEFKLSAGRLICSSFASEGGRRLLREITYEFEAQLALARDMGLRPTHADSHQHVHMNPAIFAALEEILPRYGVDRLRYGREPFPAFIFGTDLTALTKRFNLAKWALLRGRSQQIQPRLVTNEDFFGILYSGAMTKSGLMAAAARAATARSTEICIHPGFPAPGGEAFYSRSGYNDFISSSARQIEHDILLDEDLVDLLRRRGLALRAFDGRPKMPQ